MATTFYDNFDVKVTDTVFVTPRGDQYPIRNISSVQVRIKSNLILLIFGLVLIFSGWTEYYFEGKDMSAIFWTCIGLLLLIGFKFFQLGTLYIGTGGRLQAAIVLNVKRPAKRTFLYDVSNAINAAISNLQKT